MACTYGSLYLYSLLIDPVNGSDASFDVLFQTTHQTRIFQNRVLSLEYRSDHVQFVSDIFNLAEQQDLFPNGVSFLVNRGWLGLS
jgi:hypothetical protein